MKKDSHNLREKMKDLNKNDKAIFKIEDDPRIIKVAVPAPQHSPMLGQLPLSQMV